MIAAIAAAVSAVSTLRVVFRRASLLSVGFAFARAVGLSENLSVVTGSGNWLATPLKATGLATTGDELTTATGVLDGSFWRPIE
jgi:hypothetical protein